MVNFKALKVGDALPERRYTATNVSLFCYNPAFPRWLVHFVSAVRDFSIIFSRLDGLKGG